MPFMASRKSSILYLMSHSSGLSMFVRKNPDRFNLGSEKTDLYCVLRMLAISLVHFRSCLGF